MVFTKHLLGKTCAARAWNCKDTYIRDNEIRRCEGSGAPPKTWNSSQY